MSGRAGAAIAGEIRPELSWPGVVRLGLVQVAIGAVVVLMTSTLNRVMIVELGLPAVIPGTLVGLHFGVQLVRPRMGHGSDRGRRRTPWIWAGMLVVILSGVGAAAATALAGSSQLLGITLAVVCYALLGVGVAVASTPLLALLAERVPERRMAGAAAVVWVMMIAGIIASAAVAGSFLDPYSPGRLVAVTAGVGAGALVLTALALVGRDGTVRRAAGADGERDFREAFEALWAEPEARRFASFVFLSMLAYSFQDIILEPFAGSVFGLTPGESTQIAGMQHGGVLAGMAVGAVLAGRFLTLRIWSAVGCAASAVCLAGLVATGFSGSVGALQAAVVGLGAANGIFAVAAIGSMMKLTVKGEKGGAGLRMGFWGAAQALAYGAGGLLGAAGSDVARAAFASDALGYSAVFAVEAVLFLAAAGLVLLPAERPIPLARFPRRAGDLLVRPLAGRGPGGTP